MDKANADYELSDKNQSLQLRLIFGSDKVSKCLSVWHKVLSQLSLSAFSHNFFSSVSLLTFSGIFISLFSHLSITIYVNNCVCPVLFPVLFCPPPPYVTILSPPKGKAASRLLWVLSYIYLSLSSVFQSDCRSLKYCVWCVQNVSRWPTVSQELVTTASVTLCQWCSKWIISIGISS